MNKYKGFLNIYLNNTYLYKNIIDDIIKNTNI